MQASLASPIALRSRSASAPTEKLIPSAQRAATSIVRGPVAAMFSVGRGSASDGSKSSMRDIEVDDLVELDVRPRLR